MIPLATPNLTGKESEYVAQAIVSNWVGPAGPFVERFEEKVAKAAGRRWAVATITGTAALHAAAYVTMMSNGLREVEIPRSAFPAARNVLLALDYPVVMRGNGVNHDEQHYLNICDRAPAIGEPSTKADLECYSFAANKIVTCGHGGAIVGDWWGTEDRVRSIIHQGYGRSGMFNYRMANLNAALGCAQMERLDELKKAKRRIWKRYESAGLPMIERGASRWMATVDMPRGLVEYLQANDIESRAEPSGGVSLPCSTGLIEASQDEVIKACMSWR